MRFFYDNLEIPLPELLDHIEALAPLCQTARRIETLRATLKHVRNDHWRREKMWKNSHALRDGLREERRDRIG